jgi:hypothetical protein
MPESTNFYASFRNITKTKVIKAFLENGWAIRKATWTDFEMRNKWSELTLEADENEPLLSGLVAFHTENLLILNKVLDSLGGYYIYEFYNQEKQLVLEKTNNS